MTINNKRKRTTLCQDQRGVSKMSVPISTSMPVCARVPLLEFSKLRMDKDDIKEPLLFRRNDS